LRALAIRASRSAFDLDQPPNPPASMPNTRSRVLLRSGRSARARTTGRCAAACFWCGARETRSGACLPASRTKRDRQSPAGAGRLTTTTGQCDHNHHQGRPAKPRSARARSGRACANQVAALDAPAVERRQGCSGAVGGDFVPQVVYDRHDVLSRDGLDGEHVERLPGVLEVAGILNVASLSQLLLAGFQNFGTRSAGVAVVLAAAALDSPTMSMPSRALARTADASSRMALRFPFTTAPRVLRRCWAPTLNLRKYEALPL
jgi:hypothetical protein